MNVNTQYIRFFYCNVFPTFAYRFLQWQSSLLVRSWVTQQIDFVLPLV